MLDTIEQTKQSIKSNTPKPKARSSKIKFKKKESAGFYDVLKHRVDQYFKENEINKKADSRMIFKTIFILSVFIITYGIILSNTLPTGILLLVVMIHGFFTALIGLNIAHDAVHGSYSDSKRVNKILGVSFNIIGANDYVWKIMHNVIHHTYTNIPDHDGDIDQIPVIRLNPKQKLWKMHRFQYIYIFLLYPLSSISWVFIKDYVKFFNRNVEQYRKGDDSRKEFFRMLSYKIAYYILFLVVPLLVINLPWYQILLGFFIMHLVEGLTLSLIFQLAHVTEGTSFPTPNEKGEILNSWAKHQLYTTADFACSNNFVNFICGGLNFQIEHHLFPNICHIHYKKIAPIVKETAAEYDLPYIEYKTFTGAVNSHIKTLKKFGKSYSA